MVRSLAFGLSFILASIGCGPADPGELSTTDESDIRTARSSCILGGVRYVCQRDVPYGPHALQTYDLWLPPQSIPGGVPLVIYIHGGGYFQGDKASGYGESFDPAPILAGGFAFAAINYRLSGEFPYEKDVTGLYPVAMEDAARALQTLRVAAPRLGIDPAKVALTGGSAGGGISLWLAFHDDLADRRGSTAIERASTRAPCAAVADTQTTLDLAEVEALLASSYVLDVGLAGLYGLTPSEYEARPAELQARFAASFFEASPISHLTADDDVRVMMTYTLVPGSGNIHSSEFGIYLDRGQPRALKNRYGRTSLQEIGADSALFIGGNRRGNIAMLADFILTRCFD